MNDQSLEEHAEKNHRYRVHQARGENIGYGGNFLSASVVSAMNKSLAYYSARSIKMIEKMKNIVIFVKDFEAAKHFYKDLMQLPVVNESMAIMEFFSGSTTLGVAMAMHDAAMPLVGRHTGITLQVKEIDEFCRRLSEAGVSFAEPLEKTPWGKMAVVKDPDGNQFALVEA